VKARLTKFEPSNGGKSNVEIETAIRQMVDAAVVSDGVIDVFDAAGIKKPDISIGISRKRFVRVCVAM
jgi:type I restriction enzyme R subunit